MLFESTRAKPYMLIIKAHNEDELIEKVELELNNYKLPDDENYIVIVDNIIRVFDSEEKANNYINEILADLIDVDYKIID
jgi:hypothetical protein